MTNPSNKVGGEQSLEPFETCCLSEIYLSNIDSYEELLDILELSYRINKHSLLLKSHHPETQNIVHKNMRMGIGMTGVLQASEEQNSWLDEAYDYLRDFDKRYSLLRNLPPSIKLTTIKPSGTLSLLPGVTPGIHPAIAQYLIRRITIASENPLVEVCKDHGYDVEYKRNIDGTYDRGSVVVSFPYAYPLGTKLAASMSAIDQLREVKRMQTVWSDNSVSCSVYYHLEEIPAIKEYLKNNYRDNFKSLSFLLHNDSGFFQQPFEPITKEVYDEMVKQTRLITSVSHAEFEANDECASGHCPVR